MPGPGTLDSWHTTGSRTRQAVAGAWHLSGFEDWLSGRAEATRRAYVGDLTSFAEWMGRSDVTAPAGVDRLHLRRYLASLGTRQLARATVARKAAALRCYFAWALRQGLVPADPARTLRAPSGKGRLPRVLSSGEIGTLLDGAGHLGDRPAGPGGTRAALRRRAAGVRALRAGPPWRRPGRPDGDRPGQGRKGAPGPDPRSGRGRAGGVAARAGGPRCPDPPRRSS